MPAHPARTWVAALNSGDPEEILPGMLAAEDWDAWADVVFDPTRIYTDAALIRMVGVLTAKAAGMPFVNTLNLISIAGAHWREVDGRASLHGVDLLSLPLSRFCNLVLFMFTEGADDKARFKLDATINAPISAWLPHQAEPEWQPGSNDDAFATLAAMSSKGATVP